MGDLFDRARETDMRDMRFPLLPDTEHEAINPAPDGRPWRKACVECALRVSDPQDLGNRYQREIAAGIPGTLFYCVHTLDGDMHRVCACYAVLHHEQAITAAEEEKKP